MLIKLGRSFISNRRHAIIAVGTLFAALSASEAFSPQSHKMQHVRATSPSSIISQGGIGRESRRTKTAGPLFAMNSPVYTSVPEYVTSLAEPSAVVSHTVPWGACLALSAILAISVITTKEGEPKPWQKACQDGFCITGYGEGGKYVNGDTIVTNSHVLSWRADLMFTILAIALPLLNIAGVQIPSIGSYEFDPALDVVVASVALIFVHGYLHKELSKDFIPPKPSTLNIDEGAPASGDTAGFLLFSAVLVSVCIGGFSSLPDLLGNSIPKIGAVIAAVTGFVYWLTIEGNKKGLGITSYFMSTQLLVSGVGFFIPDDLKADPLMAWTFAVTCAVSLMEYYGCAKFFRNIGGHVWYDTALHTSLLTGFWLSDSVVDQITVAGTKAFMM